MSIQHDPEHTDADQNNDGISYEALRMKTGRAFVVCVHNTRSPNNTIVYNLGPTRLFTFTRCVDSH